MIITIDGPAAAGKGTLCHALAERYNLAYFDTGMVYRAVGLQMVLNQADLSDCQQATQIAEHLTFEQMMSLSKLPDFRSDVGSDAASKISAIPSVRTALLKMQQDFSKNPVFEDGTPANGVIYDGRDTGTVVCPKADIKFFVTASTEVRAMRRFKEFAQKGIPSTYDQVLSDMLRRDERDSSRATAPLKPAPDAFMIDTSNMDINLAFQTVVSLIESYLLKAK